MMRLLRWSPGRSMRFRFRIPPSGPFVAFVGTMLLVVLLTPNAFFSSNTTETSEQKKGWSGLRIHTRALLLAIFIAGIAPLFGFPAIALGLVGYVTALFKLRSVLTILWARLFLDERQMKSRLLGALVMVVGGVLVAA